MKRRPETYPVVARSLQATFRDLQNCTLGLPHWPDAPADAQLACGFDLDLRRLRLGAVHRGALHAADLATLLVVDRGGTCRKVSPARLADTPVSLSRPTSRRRDHLLDIPSLIIGPLRWKG